MSPLADVTIVVAGGEADSEWNRLTVGNALVTAEAVGIADEADRIAEDVLSGEWEDDWTEPRDDETVGDPLCECGHVQSEHHTAPAFGGPLEYCAGEVEIDEEYPTCRCPGFNEAED